MRDLIGLLMVASLCMPACNTSSGDDDDLAPGEGYLVGETLPNCALTNQDGDSMQTHDAEGDRVLLVVSAGWCEPCLDAAMNAQDLHDELSGEFGFTLFEVLIQDQWQRDDVSAEQLQVWADSAGFTTLDVWTDGLDTCIDPFVAAETLPVFVIADEALVIADVIDETYNATVEQQIIDALRAL